MLKAIIIFVNLFALIAIKLFFGGSVTVEQKFPNQVNLGESFTVEVLINKDDREGFAKWQQKLPTGFIAEILDAKGATFSFKNQEVKFIWMNLPKEESFAISYTVSIDPNLSGSYELDGKFSYIEENERKDIQSSKKTIVVGESKVEQIAEVETKEVKKEKGKTKVVPQEIKKTDNKSGDLVTNDPNIKISRKIEHIENGEYLISLSIDKGSFESFGKVEEYLPEGFVAFEGENDNSMYSFKNKVVKFLWMTLPSKNKIELTYKIKSESDLLDQVKIHGMFSYLNNDKSVQLEMQASEFKNYFGDDNAIVEKIEEVVKEEVKEPEVVVKETVSIKAEEIAEVIKEEPKPIVKEEPKAIIKEEPKEIIAEKPTAKPKELEASIGDITNIPSPESSVVYKVQIAASKSEVNQEYFVKNHQIQEMVTIEYHNSWYKYTIGKFDVYKAARDRRNQIWADNNKINDAFVTAYNSGERISVQEALMISNQKWFK